jgi:hypothetical protein
MYGQARGTDRKVKMVSENTRDGGSTGHWWRMQIYGRVRMQFVEQPNHPGRTGMMGRGPFIGDCHDGTKASSEMV